MIRRPPVYVFTCAMPGGPFRKLFSCVVEFDAYCKNWRLEIGSTAWVSPYECRGAL